MTTDAKRTDVGAAAGDFPVRGLTDAEKGAAVVKHLGRLDWDAPPTITHTVVHGWYRICWTAQLNGVPFGLEHVGQVAALIPLIEEQMTVEAARLLDKINAEHWKEKLSCP